MSARASGFTLLEVIISAAVLVAVVGLSLGVMGTTSAHVAESTISSDLRRRGQNAARILQRELRSVASETVQFSNPDPNVVDGYWTMSYSQVVSFDPTATPPRILDPLPAATPHRLRFLLDSGETADGDDDDGDGLIDEGRVVLERGGTVIAELASGVRDFRFSVPSGASSVMVGDTHLRLQFIVQQRGRSVGIVESYSVFFDVGLRN